MRAETLLTLLKPSGLLERLPEGVGAIGDLAYAGIAEAHPQHLGATPRRKRRGKERPPEDIDFNRAFSKRRIKVEHTSGIYLAMWFCPYWSGQAAHAPALDAQPRVRVVNANDVEL